jgi:hypothetical protein
MTKKQYEDLLLRLSKARLLANDLLLEALRARVAQTETALELGLKPDKPSLGDVEKAREDEAVKAWPELEALIDSIGQGKGFKR